MPVVSGHACFCRIPRCTSAPRQPTNGEREASVKRARDGYPRLEAVGARKAKVELVGQHIKRSHQCSEPQGVDRLDNYGGSPAIALLVGIEVYALDRVHVEHEVQCLLDN